MSAYVPSPGFYRTPFDFTTLNAEPVPTGDWNPPWLWIVVCGGLAAFFVAWGIGANDVANSFATSVGSGTLKLWQAIIIAAIFEFAGAVGLGSETTKTVAGDITNLTFFNKQPELYMYGMLTALFVAGCWLLIATYYLMPVSTTHSIIGAIMGFSVVVGGGWGVQWNTQRGNFPYSRGLLPVVLSWFFSPIIGGILSSIIFNLNRFFILRSKNSMWRALWSIPFLIFITLFINIMFVLAKGAASYMDNTWPCTTKTGGMFGLSYTDCTDMYNASAWIAAVTAAGIALTFGIGFMMYVRKLVLDKPASTGDVEVDGVKPKAWEDSLATDKEKADAEDLPPDVKYPYPKYPENDSYLNVMVYSITFLPIAFVQQCKRGLFTNIHTLSGEKAVNAGLSDNAEVFDFDTERVFQWLQVISACCVAFAHGANDVANAIGPFSAIMTVYGTRAVPGSNSNTQMWVYVLGGIGIVVGLMMYGYTIIYQLGKNLIHLTPSRGYSAELAAGLTISLASFYGIPVSTTQIITGCEVGVGLCEGAKGLSWRLFGKIFLGWVLTIFIALAACAAVFAAGAYPPCITQMQTLTNYQQELLNGQLAILRTLNNLNLNMSNNAAYWSGAAIGTPVNGSALNSTISSLTRSVTTLNNANRYVDWTQVMYYVSRVSQLLQAETISIIGQSNLPALLNGTAFYTPIPASGATNGYGK